ncbi:MAG TPA: helix-turn-helix transcriptional regulator [Ktedonosporobacter sp.]|nr:helix-turn-helix transcriptional regulator [Ktedonosporobacter sp.]
MEVPPLPHANSRLREERVRRNWRQQDVADQVGTTVVTVKRWERGSQQPSMYFRLKLCTLFGKSAEELGLLTEEPMPSGLGKKYVSRCWVWERLRWHWEMMSQGTPQPTQNLLAQAYL